jgi:putative ABC transport system permease protein
LCRATRRGTVCFGVLSEKAENPFRWETIRVHRLFTAIRLALDSIRAHKLRSFLTLLGVIIGVASVVLVGAAIDGLGAYAEATTAKAFGTDSFLLAQIAATGRLTRKQVVTLLKRNKRLRLDDITFLRETTGDQILYSPYRQKVEDVRRGELLDETVDILGVSSFMPSIRDITIEDGRFFTETEARTKQPVAVLGQDVVTALFPAVSPLGRSIKFSGMEFTVVGVQERIGSSFGRPQDNCIWIPDTVFNRLYGPGVTVTIFGKARAGSGLSLEDSLDIARVALRTRFHTRARDPDNFGNLTPDSIRSFVDNILGMISMVVVPVTMISLVVGGIVIMNIMLVSVTERTREIGVRKSLGARRTDILLQFLIEAVVLSAMGGVLGLLAGMAAAAGLSRTFDLRLPVTVGYAVLAIAVSSVVGVLSGWYPAARASRLDPVVALRAE